MKINNILIVIGIITVLIFAVGCGKSVETSDDGDDNQLTGNPRVIEVVARQWEFEPDRIVVNQGDYVELHLSSEDVAHGIFITGYGINERIDPDQDVHVNFRADKKGEFPFKCSVACGSGHGTMGGTLVVK